jgi:hypothetical protein
VRRVAERGLDHEGRRLDDRRAVGEVEAQRAQRLVDELRGARRRRAEEVGVVGVVRELDDHRVPQANAAGLAEAHDLAADPGDRALELVHRGEFAALDQLAAVQRGDRERGAVGREAVAGDVGRGLQQRADAVVARLAGGVAVAGEQRLAALVVEAEEVLAAGAAVADKAGAGDVAAGVGQQLVGRQRGQPGDRGLELDGVDEPAAARELAAVLGDDDDEVAAGVVAAIVAPRIGQRGEQRLDVLVAREQGREARRVQQRLAVRVVDPGAEEAGAGRLEQLEARRRRPRARLEVVADGRRADLQRLLDAEALDGGDPVQQVGELGVDLGGRGEGRAGGEHGAVEAADRAAVLITVDLERGLDAFAQAGDDDVDRPQGGRPIRERDAREGDPTVREDDLEAEGVARRLNDTKEHGGSARAESCAYCLQS